MADEVLNLSTTDFDRPVIRIDGEAYHLRARDEIRVPDQQRFRRFGERFEELSERDASDETVQEQADALADAVREVTVDLPDDVIAQLGPYQLNDILQAFFGQIRAGRDGGRPTSGGSQSRGASGSSAVA